MNKLRCTSLILHWQVCPMWHHQHSNIHLIHSYSDQLHRHNSIGTPTTVNWGHSISWNHWLDSLNTQYSQYRREYSINCNYSWGWILRVDSDIGLNSPLIVLICMCMVRIVNLLIIPSTMIIRSTH